MHTQTHFRALTHTHTNRARKSCPERQCCIGFSSGSAAPPKLWSDERRRAESIGSEQGVVRQVCVCMCVCVSGGGAVVCLTDAGLPARRRAKDQRGRRGWGKRAARCRRDTNITLWPSVQHTHIASTRLNVADEICQRGKQHDQD